MGERNKDSLTKNQKIFGPQTKPLEWDTDSMMTDVNTTQNQKQTETPSNFAKREPSENRSQQIPNTDPKATGGNNWAKQEWGPAEREAWAYYMHFAMGYEENNPETQEKEKQKGDNK